MAGQQGVLSSLLALFDGGSPLSQAAVAYATAAIRAQHLLTSASAQQSAPAQQKLLQQTDKLLSHVAKRAAKVGAADQVAALQLLATCISCCSAQDLLQHATTWGLQLADTLRQSVAALPAAATTTSGPLSAATATATYQAACAATTALFKRLQQFIELSGVRRQVSAIPGKLLPQVLAVISNTDISRCHAPALQLLAAVLLCTPGALRSNLTTVDRALLQLPAAAAASLAPEAEQVLADAAVCISLLPAVSGDSSTWSETARKLLCSCHEVLDYMSMGLEGAPWNPAARAALQAQPAAAAAGGGTAGTQQQRAAGAASSAGGWLQYPWQLSPQQGAAANGVAGTAAASSSSNMQKLQLRPAARLLGMLVASLQCLLQSPFPVAVPMPSEAVLSVAVRLTRVDPAAAVAAGAVAASKSMYQDLLTLQPQLQLSGWLLLQMLVGVAGQQLLPLHGQLVSVVREGLRAVRLAPAAAIHTMDAGLRRALYAAAAQVLVCVGFSMATSLAADVLGVVLAEVYGEVARQSSQSNHLLAGSSAQRPSKRQRTSGGLPADQFDAANSLAAAGPPTATSSVAAAAAVDLQAQVHVLQLLQTLFEVAGPALTQQVRAHADAAAFHVAQTTTDALLQLRQQAYIAGSSCNLGSSLQLVPDGSAAGVGPGQLGQTSSTLLPVLRAVQLSSYQALLASVLSPCGSRPPYLSQALSLFRGARGSSSSALASFSCQAAMACEALLHPRATPLAAAGGGAAGAGAGAAAGLFSSLTVTAAAPGQSLTLQRPRLWSVVDAALAVQAVPTGGQQQQQTAAPMEGVTLSGMQAPGEVQLGEQQAPGRDVPLMAPVAHNREERPVAGWVAQQGGVTAAPAPATAPAAAMAPHAKVAAADAVAAGPSQGLLQPVGGGVASGSSSLPTFNSGGAPQPTPQQQQQQQQQLASAPGFLTGAVTAAAAAPPPLHLQQQQGATAGSVQPTAAAGGWPGSADEVMSSDDSEGPLPDIDSGRGSDSDGASSE